MSRQRVSAGTGCAVAGDVLLTPSDASQICVLLGLGDISLISKALELYEFFKQSSMLTLKYDQLFSLDGCWGNTYMTSFGQSTNIY